MHIFLTNDDGIYAPGLRQLCAMAVHVGHKVTVCAPDRECSAASHSITVFDPLRAHPLEIEGARAFAVAGRPADCVRLGLTSLIDSPVDVVISGINRGANEGLNCAYSGTVGAAVEGAVVGVQSLATSFCSFTNDDYDAPCRMTLKVAAWMLAHPLPWGVIYNLNTPNLPFEEIKGIKYTSLAPRLYESFGYERRVTPFGRDYYWIDDRRIEAYEDDCCDAAATMAGYASLTALTWDMTYRGAVDLEGLAL